MIGRRLALVALTASSLAACGGGSGSDAPAIVFVDPPAAARVSGDLALTDGCAALPPAGTLYPNARVEPYVAADPSSALRLIGTWQQNRWSGGGAQAVIAAASFDGGQTWTRTTAPFSVCTGGTAANGGDFERVTDPWVTVAPNGVVHWMALAFSGPDTFAAGSASAPRVTRSTDGGRTWEPPVTLIRDGAQAFNDKISITADPADSNFVYAVWDRLVPGAGGPAWFARTTDGGQTWEPARLLFDPGASAQTLGNVIAVQADGALVNAFNRITVLADNVLHSEFDVMRSTDHGATWSTPVKVADMLAGGAFDPDTRTAIRDGSELPQIAAAPNGDLYVVWQDGRFVSGIDSIAFARSSDGGLTWSEPMRINGAPGAQAFTPQLSVLADGTVGVTYFDLRSNTPDPSTLPTEYWLTRSSDGGATWREARIAGPFDLALAPNARGLFLGDYQGLAQRGGEFVAFFAQTTRAALPNPTEVFSFAVTAPAQAQAAVPGARRYRATAAAAREPSAGLRARASANIARVLQRRSPSWSKWMSAPITP